VAKDSWINEKIHGPSQEVGGCRDKGASEKSREEMLGHIEGCVLPARKKGKEYADTLSSR